MKSYYVCDLRVEFMGAYWKLIDEGVKGSPVLVVGTREEVLERIQEEMSKVPSTNRR